MNLTGSSVQNITKVTQSDVFTEVQQTVVGDVTVPEAMITADGAMPLGTLLTSTDGGLTWNSLTTPAYDAADAPYADAAQVYFEGHIFTSTVANNNTVPNAGDWTDEGAWDANGVLFNDLTESRKTTIVVTGTAKQKHLVGHDSFIQATLFKNKIIAK